MSTNKRSADDERLERMVSKAITRTFKDSLALVEMLGLEDKQFQRIRKMVLRAGNDEIRKTQEELGKYEVKYTPQYNEEIDFTTED
jgi:hypothetical protein